jgi:hypothetical protein
MTTESTADFKERIARMMRERETGHTYSVIGGPRAHECVVRKTKTYGRNHWDRPAKKGAN